MKGLIIAAPWITLILEGKKSWEIRGRSTKIRGKIALIEKGTKTIVGYAELTDVKGPLSDAEVRKNKSKHAVDPKIILDPIDGYDDIYAWILTDVVKLRVPKPYRHKSGCVTWVNIPC